MFYSSNIMVGFGLSVAFFVPFFIVLGVILFIAIIVLIGVFKFKNIANQITGRRMSVTNMIDEINRHNREYDNQSKSVSGMTNLILPRIAKDFPDFNYEEMKSRAELVLTSFLRAITEKDTGLMKDAGDELIEQASNRINDMRLAERYEHYENIVIHQTAISAYNKNNGRCNINFQMAVGYLFYVLDSDGRVISGSRTDKKETRYNVDLMYVQDRDIVAQSGTNAMGVNCPNCGAPIKMLGSKNCAYCGTAVVDINRRVWIFSSVNEMERRVY